MGQPGRPRRAADELLLREGPLPRERVILEIQKHVLPGVAARTAARNWRTPDDPRHGDPYAVGSRAVAVKTLDNGLRDGKLIEEAGYIRHRDWAVPVEVAFTIPTRDELDGMARLLHASDWERAAIVAAFVTLGEGKGKSVGNATSSISPEAFAAKGIAGLKSKDTVRRYVEAWVATGRPPPEPGQSVALPTQPFPRIGEQAAAEPDGELPSTKARRQSAPPAPSRSNDPAEWWAWFRAHKSPEFVAALIESAPQPQTRPRRRTRGGVVIQMRERKNA